jgi:hypothetical protein
MGPTSGRASEGWSIDAPWIKKVVVVALVWTIKVFSSVLRATSVRLKVMKDFIRCATNLFQKENIKDPQGILKIILAWYNEGFRWFTICNRVKARQDRTPFNGSNN